MTSNRRWHNPATWVNPESRTVTRSMSALITAAGVALLGVAVVTVLSVALRLAGRPEPALFEFAEYGILFLTMLAVAPLIIRDGHVKVDLIPRTINPRINRVIDAASKAVVVVVHGLLAYTFGFVALENYRSGAVMVSYLSPPRWPFLAIILIAIVGALLAALIKKPVDDSESGESDSDSPGNERPAADR